MVHILTELPAAERPGVMVYLNWASKQANSSSTHFKFHILLTSRPRDMFYHQVATNLKKIWKSLGILCGIESGYHGQRNTVIIVLMASFK